MKKLRWLVRLISPPPALKYCKKCAGRAEFISSGLFRVNAQKRSLDVWLIYKCRQCDTTWNAEVFSRVNPQSIPRELLEGFHGNDSALADRYAADPGFLKRNGAEAGPPEYEILGEPFSLEEETELEILSDWDSPLKLSGLLRSKLSLSGSRYVSLVENGSITAPEGRDLMKGKLKRGIVLHFYPKT